MTSKHTPYLKELQEATAPLCDALKHHPLYARLKRLEDVRFFMSRHVFAVWDFMSLLKRLQQDLTCVTVPWRPTSNPTVRRLIHEIVLEEASDQFEGRYLSHYEMYRHAMGVCGASTEDIDLLLAQMDAGLSWEDALSDERLPAAVQAFSGATAEVVLRGSTHEVAGAFAIGRECSIPTMFTGLVNQLAAQSPQELGVLREYLNRHIELDGDHHGPMTLEMLKHLCGTDAARWRETTQAAVNALNARLALWDAMNHALLARPAGPTPLAQQRSGVGGLRASP